MTAAQDVCDGARDRGDVVSEREAQIVGREPELAVLEEFLGDAALLRALVITGEPGIGKSTLWEAGIVAARERGLRSSRPEPRVQRCGSRTRLWAMCSTMSREGN